MWYEIFSRLTIAFNDVHAQCSVLNFDKSSSMKRVIGLCGNQLATERVDSILLIYAIRSLCLSCEDSYKALERVVLSWCLVALMVDQVQGLRNKGALALGIKLLHNLQT